MSVASESNRRNVQKIRIPGGEARAAEVKRDEYVSVVDIEGQQVGDFIAFNSQDISEHLSMTHTMTSLMSIFFHVGDYLRSNRRNPMFELVIDTVGSHDTLLAPCDPQRYLMDYGVESHRNCLDNFCEALAVYGINQSQIPGTWNLFENVVIGKDGLLEIEPPRSNAGDRVVLRALMDVIVAVSACPMDLNPTNAGAVTDLLLIVDSELPGENR
jgi:uncharacterized protein YcgI (DUF1989 family)